MDVLQFDFKRLDVFRKVPSGITQATATGGIISLCSTFFIFFLFFAELHSFLTPDIVSELFVDDPEAHARTIPVFLDISIPNMKCESIELDVQDDLGREEKDLKKNVNKNKINNLLGCRLQAYFEINQVPGNFHIATHGIDKKPKEPNMTHIVHQVRFGDMVTEGLLPGSFTPLSEVDRISRIKALAFHDYFMKIVPSIFHTDKGEIYPYQYTFGYRNFLQYANEKIKGVQPTIVFRYHVLAIAVKYSIKYKAFYTFLTSVCAIVGGTFTVAGIIDSLVFTGSELMRKMQTGKIV